MLVVIAIGASACSLFKSKGGDSGSPGAERSVSAETPEFSFKMNNVYAVPTVAGAKISHAKAQEMAAGVSETMANYFKAAYLDPNNWKNDNYAAAWAFFDKAAVADAKANAASLTLGDGSAYDTVTPKPSTSSVKVLIGDGGKPLTADAQVTFGALATDGSGTETTIANLGHFFLKPSGKDWVIVAYTVKPYTQAGDHYVGSPTPAPKHTKPSPSPSS